MELVPKTDEEITELARGIVTNRIWAAWDPETLDSSFGIFLSLAASGAAAQGQDNSWLGDIGLVYEELSRANERSVNGYPSFFSAQYINREDRIKVQRECIRMSIALGSLPETALDDFDASVVEYYEDAAEAAAAETEPETETEEQSE